jgi:hypothetical protein
MQDPEKKTEYYIKLTGKTVIEKPLELSKGYEITIKGEITACTEIDKYDGVHAKMFKFTPIQAEIKDELGRVIKVRDMRTMSQKLRRIILWLWEQNLTETRDPETAYQETMSTIISEAEYLYMQGLKREK